MTDTGLLGGATLLGVFVGPVLAVLIALYLKKRHADKERKMEIYRTLMRTRGFWDRDHVGALNLVEVEFRNHDEVIKMWKAYISNLRKDFSNTDANKERGELLTKLIYEIAKVLNIKVEQLAILKGNYVPIIWGRDEWEERVLRRGLINQLYESQQEQSPYPPPPSQDLN